MEVKEQYHIHIRKRMAALINLDDIGNFRSVSESVNEDIQILVNIGVKKKKIVLKAECSALVCDCFSCHTTSTELLSG